MTDELEALLARLGDPPEAVRVHVSSLQELERAFLAAGNALLSDAVGPGTPTSFMGAPVVENPLLPAGWYGIERGGRLVVLGKLGR